MYAGCNLPSLFTNDCAVARFVHGDYGDVLAIASGELITGDVECSIDLHAVGAVCKK
ncbi:hypothetical protein ACP70R_035793 [Stipagrostis hirtigluma subsp. patula]